KANAELTKIGRFKRKEKNIRDSVFVNSNIRLESNINFVPNDRTINIPSTSSINNNFSQETLAEFNNEDSVDQSSSVDLFNSIKSWSLRHNINRNAITDLLKTLNSHGHSLPNDSRSLLSTPRNILTQKIEPGELIYIGLQNQLDWILRKSKKIPPLLLLDCNIDGAPIYKNSYSHGCIWPILCQIPSIKSQVFVVAIYGGNSKPQDFNQFIKPFVDEYLKIQNNYSFDGQKICIKLNNIILDLPARSSVCGIMGHCGRSACPFCHALGERSNNRTFLVDFHAPRRTDLESRTKTDKMHNKKISEFERITELDMIQNFPLDYLHNVLLGVMRKLLKLWFGNKGLYSTSAKARVSLKINNYSSYEPKEFNRRLRGLEKMEIWKGTELRTFLLFIGPVVLKDEISALHYNNFILLHVAISILIDKELCITYNAVAKSLLYNFVESYLTNYGNENFTINTHLLIHLPEHCLRNGSLDNFSSFKFESFLNQLGKLVHSPLNPLKQIFNRISEIINSQSSDLFQNYSQNNTSILFKDMIGDNIYRKIIINNVVLDGDSNHNGFVQLTNGYIVKVKRFLKNNNIVTLKGITFEFLENIYEYPIESKDINAYKVIAKKFIDYECNINLIKRKMFFLPISDCEYFVYPMNDFFA
ncbi:uncharacterized protein, partial [Chironomus tepperi]|uniref:uncharacterized protein n=1 Tax=Chironomus tepperi TaxID=113505 RepID=UPI00391F9B6E